uniref:Polycystic kidney and hepatic disease 1 (autosomal recessive)-like 1 n=1 Tax=Pygocentrus nattereri TaxID=42514 RepID=A0AAR2IPV4_PYGNA
AVVGWRLGIWPCDWKVAGSIPRCLENDVGLFFSGFAQQSQFSLNIDDPDIGNFVTLVSRTRSFPCDVERDASVSNKITCYTRAMPEDDYEVHVKVDGVPIPASSVCWGMKWYYCTRNMGPLISYTDTCIHSLFSSVKCAGTLVTLQGRIMTDVYSSSTGASPNGRNVRFVRAYMGGMPCVLLKPNSDELYGLRLDYMYSDWGSMSCKMTGTYVGHHNFSYIIDGEFGRSLPDFQVYSVSALNKISMFQTYAEVTGVSPSEGSTLGGTLLTIHGHYFDKTDRPAEVLVGGRKCEVQSLTDETITCRTPEYDWSNKTVFPGGRGIKMETWINTNVRYLEDVLAYNSSQPGYSVQWVDSLSYEWPGEIQYLVARLSGFFVPTETDNYYFLIKGSYRFQLYFSTTGRPQDKVKIAYLDHWGYSYNTSSTQRSKVMHLEKGKAYYVEVLLQQYTMTASIDVGFFKERSPFTAQQTQEAVNEKQVIQASYDVLDEKQVCHICTVHERKTATYIENSVFHTINHFIATVSLSGDFDDLHYWTNLPGVNITVRELRKGRADLNSFTLLWGGIPSSPLPYQASETQVDAQYFLCRWQYTCVDLLEALQTRYAGSNYKLQELRLHRDTGDYYIDTVQLRAATATDINGESKYFARRPPALANSGHFFQRISVHKLSNASHVSYEITASPYNCAFGVPLMEVGFLQVTGRFTEDALVLVQNNATVTVTRTQRASPPLSGYFSAEIFGLAVDISAKDLQYALQGIPDLGQLSVTRTGDCKGYSWYIEWLTMPGSQPLLQINDSTVAGVNSSVTAQVKEHGGLFKQSIMGDFLRVPTNKTQVEVLINGIPSKCSGDCGFTWSAAKTPTVTGISPSQGRTDDQRSLKHFARIWTTKTLIPSVGLQMKHVEGRVCELCGHFPRSPLKCNVYSFKHISHTGRCLSGASALGTVLTISGSGFVGGNASVQIGNVQCSVLQNVTLKSGEMEATANDSFTYDNALTAVITDVSPQTTTVFGLRTLTIQGQNFEDQTNGSSVLIGSVDCVVLTWTNENITCLLPSLPPGVYHVSVGMGNRGSPQISAGVNATIAYVLQVSGLSPQQGSLYGGTTVTITGSGFSPDLADNTVTLGTETWQVYDVFKLYKTHFVTNQGINFYYGQGYAWSPATVMASVGDTVVWKWNAPDFVSGLGYRVFSVASASSTEFDGVGFSSGNTKTATGFFSYRFTAPGVYYYSSGYVDVANQRSLQGVVNVRPLEEISSGLQVTVAGFQALRSLGTNTSSNWAALPKNCPGSNITSDSFSFRFSTCASPTVDSISPLQGTVHDPIVLRGSGFSNISCANEVTVGNASCRVTNSTSTEITCLLSSDSGAPVLVPLPVRVRVNNLGAAMLTMPSELSRRVVILPVVDSISPSAGSTSGRTRLVISGSGLSGGTVTVAGVPCIIVSSNYTQVLCDTSPSPPRTGSITVRVGAVSSSCSSDCSYEYSAALAPQVSSVYPSSVSGNQTTVFVSGSNFGSSLENIAVFADDFILDVTNITDNNITVSVGALPAGPHSLQVVVRNKGLAIGSVTLTSEPLASLQPTSGSLAGGTLLMITGNGFVAGNTSVMVGVYPCSILQVTPSTVQCLTRSYDEQVVQVKIQVFGVIYPLLTLSALFLFLLCFHVSGPSGTAITISGSGFGSEAGLVSVNIDGVPCAVSSVTDTEVRCTAGEHAGGTYPVTMTHQAKGLAQSQSIFTYELRLTQVSPNEGSYAGGAVVAVQGTGFDPISSKVLICSKECSVRRNASSSTALYCEVPPNNGTQAEQACMVMVLNTYASANITNGYTYKSSLTPVITDVSPRRGGTAGGTVLTITGSGFSGGNITVTIAGSVCDVRSVNETKVICVTNAQPMSQMAKVRVQVGDKGIAQMDRADFFYIDVWSSRYTWGGESPPEKGTFAVITKGQTILLDVSTPVLKMLLIQGGKLIFDEADIELQAENILITDGGALQIGTEDQPFQHKAIITLHGHLRSPEIPVYGAKTLGIREGVLDLHGIPIPVPWTRLAQTARNGSRAITLMHAVTWRVGDEVVIASTGHRYSQIENEVRIIAAVSADGRTLNLTQPLKYTHLGESITLPDGTVFEAKAEVGVLTRNVVVRGSVNQDWNDLIPACPDGFNTGEFATQTCFQGRFGEEVGSDQFGGCIMFHAPRPNENLAVGRIEYVEIFNAGQAFRLGRYPIHWHLMGDLKLKSYIRGCSIHQTYNRAVTIHNTHRLLVEHNVIYNIMGGAFFIEDGIETGNVLQYNLAVFVKQSTSLLNDDLTPASYWVTNPNNTIRHNAAAGGTHFGFWYRMLDHPDGPSYDSNICQKRAPLGEFYNNTAHSQGWFGLWIFKEFFPTQQGTCGSYTPQPAVFRKFTSWNNDKGAEWMNVGSVQFSEFLMVNNERAGVETKRIIEQFVSGWGLNGGAALVNSTLVGHVDELGLGSSFCTTRGLILPLDDGMSILNTRFINFDRPSCAAISMASITGTCSSSCGGWSAKFSGIQFYQTPNKAVFRWEHEVVFIDTDGSLTGNPGNKVLPKSNLLDPAHCSYNASWSMGFPGSVCDNTTSFHRLVFNNPSYMLFFRDAILTNAYGSTIVPFTWQLITPGYGWMALLPSAQTYKWYFRDISQITEISYSATFYGFRPQDYVIVNHNLTKSPDYVRIVDNRNSSSDPLNATVNVNGDWYFNKSSNDLFYMGKTADLSIECGVYCYFNIRNQIDMNVFPSYSKGTLPAPMLSFLQVLSYWQTVNRASLPAAFCPETSTLVSTGIWMILDIAIPSLNKLAVLGVLEIPDTMNSTSSSLPEYRSVVLNATYISIQGGRLIAGSSDQPFRGDLQIILRGNRYTPEWPLSNGQNQGSKVLGVFGTLDLYGLPHNVYRTKLASTAQAGSNTISLQEPVDWQAGDEIVLSTSSYDPGQTETRTITAVTNNNLTLTLDQPLTYTHISESYTVDGTSQSYRLASDVGLLSRNIKIIGQDYPNLFTESFGARVLVGAFSRGGISYRGKARIRDVEFYHTGQEGWTNNPDPRYSLAFLNLGVNESYIKGCAIHHGFAPAIGIFGTDGLSVDDNVIHHAVGEGSLPVCRRIGTNVVLQGNIVAGYERVGFRIDGEPCPGYFSAVAQWQQNEAHGGLYGVYMNGDGLPGCSQIQDFTVWRSYDFGIYFQVSMSVIVSNVTLVDNGMGIMSLIYGPPSLSHVYSNKTVLVQNALIVGSSPNFNCSDSMPMDTNMFQGASSRAPRPLNGGKSGISWPTFESSHNGAPVNAHNGLTSYNAISGLLSVTDTTFAGFRNVCLSQTDYMFMTNPGNDDLQHPIYVKRITKIDSTEEAQVFIYRPDLSKVNPSDCVDMDCDGKKKAMLNDLDGSFLGAVGAVIPQSEYEWNGNPRRGLGDYRIPKVMLTYLNGSRIPVNQIAPNKGIIRSSSCTYMSTWQAYKCLGLTYRMLVIESLDSDTEKRRLSPVAMLGDSYVDLLNGPQDHGWCFGYSCHKRVSLFHSIIATNRSFDIFFTSTTPQKLRLMMLNTVRVAVFYSNPQRLDVYVNNRLVAPTNADWNKDKTDYTLLKPNQTGQYLPSLSSTLGSNFFDPDYKMMHVLLRGSDPIEIRTSPVLFVAFNLPFMTEAEFFGDKLVTNLAAFLKVPPNMIRITNIIREGSARQRRSTGLTVQVEIKQPPVNETSSDEQFAVLKNIADNLGQAAVSGNLSQSIGFNVSSVGVIPPSPPPSDPSWSQGACVSVGVTTLTITAVLKDANVNPVDGLYGNTTIPFSNCWANYTDLAISIPGKNLNLAFTLNNWSAQSRSFTVLAVPSVAGTSPSPKLP